MCIYALTYRYKYMEVATAIAAAKAAAKAAAAACVMHVYVAAVLSHPPQKNRYKTRNSNRKFNINCRYSSSVTLKK